MTEQLKAAALLALDALESLQGGCTDSDDGTVEAITVYCPEVIDALRAALAADAVPTEREDAASVARLLDAMSVNYAAGHVWDKLDSAACKRASIAIRTLLAAAPQPASEPQPAQWPIVDLRVTAYEQLAEAAARSNWIPPEYASNDWIADCVRFLDGSDGAHDPHPGSTEEYESWAKDGSPVPGVDASDAPSLMDSARRALEAWDCTVLEAGRDGMLQERMECLRWSVRAEGGEA